MSKCEVGAIFIDGIYIGISLVLVLGLKFVALGKLDRLLTKMLVQLIQKFIGCYVLPTLLQEVLS